MPENEKSKYTLKHEMLQELQANKKNHFIAVLLLFLLGGFGAHRFYLGNNIVGFVILGLWISILLFTLSGFKTDRVLLLIMIWLIIIVVEYIRIIKVIDKRNAKLRKELEIKYGLDTFG